jgi:hypothetical protein
MGIRRNLAIWGAVIAAVLLLRVLWGGRAECGRAAEELDAGRPYQAVLHYERAVRWYLPGSPYVGRAADELWAMGEAADAAGDAELALFAFRGLRGAAYATRSFYQPLSSRIEAAELRIAELMVADPAARWPDRTLGEEARRAEVLANLQQHTDPATGWVIALEVGFVAWLGAGGALAWRLGRGGNRRRTTLWLAATFASGYALWIVGMWRA